LLAGGLAALRRAARDQLFPTDDWAAASLNRRVAPRYEVPPHGRQRRGDVAALAELVCGADGVVDALRRRALGCSPTDLFQAPTLDGRRERADRAARRHADRTELFQLRLDDRRNLYARRYEAPPHAFEVARSKRAHRAAKRLVRTGNESDDRRRRGEQSNFSDRLSDRAPRYDVERAAHWTRDVLDRSGNPPSQPAE
jgi:hypothetical protein